VLAARFVGLGFIFVLLAPVFMIFSKKIRSLLHVGEPADHAEKISRMFSHVHWYNMRLGMGLFHFIWYYTTRPVWRHFMTSYLEDRLQELMRALKEGYVESLAEKNDSELVVAGTALLDKYLEIAIMVRFPVQMSKRRCESVFSYPGPLGTFAAKIVFAEAFGLLVGDMHHDLTKLRTLRNHFAHAIHVPALTDPDVSQDCLALRLRYGLKEETIAKVGSLERQRIIESVAQCMMYLTITLVRAVTQVEMARENAEEVNRRTRKSFEEKLGIKLPPVAEAAT
jgi:hypothetical protein